MWSTLSQEGTIKIVEFMLSVELRNYGCMVQRLAIGMTVVRVTVGYIDSFRRLATVAKESSNPD